MTYYFSAISLNFNRPKFQYGIGIVMFLGGELSFLIPSIYLIVNNLNNRI